MRSSRRSGAAGRVAADAGIGDRGVDRLVVHDESAAGAAAGDPPGVRRGGPGGPDCVRARSDRPVRLVVSRAVDPGGRGPGVDVAGVGDDLWFFAVHVGGDDCVASGRGDPGRDVAADQLPGSGHEDAGAGPAVGDRGRREGDGARGGVRRDPGSQDPAGSAAGCGIQGHGRARQRVRGVLVPAGTALHLADRLQRPVGRVAGEGERSHGALGPGPAGGPAGDRPAGDAPVPAARPGRGPFQQDPAGPGPLRAHRHQRLLARSGGDRPVRRRRRVDEHCHGHLRGPAGCPPPPFLGQGPGPHRSRERRERGTAAVGLQHRAPPPPGCSHHADGHGVALRALADYDALFGVDFTTSDYTKASSE